MHGCFPWFSGCFSLWKS
uniref:Uncharacterized protein n=1 Tax=Arundo donax TaxID=35708 RepID=A0A0A9FAH1_ARUDO